MAFLISQSGLLFIVTQYHVYLKCISQLTTLVFVSMAFLISQSSLLFIVTQYHGNKYGGMRSKLQPFKNFWNLLLLWLLRAPTPCPVPRPTCWWKSGGDPVHPTPKLAGAGLHGHPRQCSLLWKWFFQNYYFDCTLHRGPTGRIFAHIIC